MHCTQYNFQAAAQTAAWKEYEPFSFYKSLYPSSTKWKGRGIIAASQLISAIYYSFDTVPENKSLELRVVVENWRFRLLQKGGIHP